MVFRCREKHLNIIDFCLKSQLTEKIRGVKAKNTLKKFESLDVSVCVFVRVFETEREKEKERE